ncbi:MAG: tRNA 5-methoxyuridine(34)/uridine 5-oxyacetic acid(34) synthase CmoB [Melioribacteraceae bacterium]|nr:tRNA 5-methoxyuridine(34)/uridine 5-oxyacetic acid(34) synthase CmoB [Melioribacteraceae bacterium]MCF8263054.1 tRNA 5-methoxyuridine(34)/uridine 5-oxyacetic acid(34) synthase CmoB [Melioribacteraceae bacterium]MCF8431254.1 tRNA 5-methoxyuridine(34)/uridine 5-oxyacetic acid(34) synthase CmoB [Melioribacteraceae bacterium]
MINLEKLQKGLYQTGLKKHFQEILEKMNSLRHHGDYNNWLKVLAMLPDIEPSKIDLNSAAIQVGHKSDIPESEANQFNEILKKFHPWRKGPFEIFGNYIDSEWRSDWKWERVKNAVDLKDKVVLDVGCGNGYHCWRIRGAGAKKVIGIDPFLLSNVQFYAIKKYVPDEHVWMLQLKMEDLPSNLQSFDVVYSMGVLYHRRSPFDHLYELKSALKPGGELILETLIIEGKEGELLVPKDRYAKMRNVWFIPSVASLVLWLQRTGFINIETVDISQTTIKEQRKTDWMQWESLSDFLDPNDQNKTIEAYPSPKRAVLKAELPK